MDVYLHLYFGLDVPETCELIEMSSESVSCMVESFVACADETAAFDYIMSLVEGGSGEVFVDWMDLEFLEGIDGSNGMLPDIAYDIVEVASFEHVDWIRRHPKLHIDVAHRLVLPVGLILLQNISNGIVFIFSRQASVFSCFLASPFAEGSCL